ncbi:hypothetical protein BDZ89DRAFT_274087 [Hymenopellis radicata]|nr:hypothetical protein BDZ89DRAFT_274087 [Hymenopellis radicata]
MAGCAAKVISNAQAALPWCVLKLRSEPRLKTTATGAITLPLHACLLFDSPCEWDGSTALIQRVLPPMSSFFQGFAQRPQSFQSGRPSAHAPVRRMMLIFGSQLPMLSRIVSSLVLRCYDIIAVVVYLNGLDLNSVWLTVFFVYSSSPSFFSIVSFPPYTYHLRHPLTCSVA